MSPDLCRHHDQRAIVIEPCQERHDQITWARSGALPHGALPHTVVNWVQMIRHVRPSQPCETLNPYKSVKLHVFSISNPLNPGFLCLLFILGISGISGQVTVPGQKNQPLQHQQKRRLLTSVLMAASPEPQGHPKTEIKNALSKQVALG